MPLDQTRHGLTLTCGFAAAALLVSCATGPEPGPELESECRTTVVVVDAEFDGGGMAGCRVVNEREIEVHIVPEDRPINPSPWYAVQLTPVRSGDVTITLVYDEHPHRYRPKLSDDGQAWRYVADSNVSAQDDGMRVRVSVSLAQSPQFLTGQELLVRRDYESWLAAHAAHDEVRRSQIGRSIENRPIDMLTTRARDSRGSVVLVGRQHPPELSGAVAMLAFVDEVLGPSDLAQSFRERFNTIVVPLMNPDGVTLGHWRHNLGGTDLNRDWGPFAQPETRAFLDVLDALADTPAERPVVFLDFHSTRRNVFYTQPIGLDGTGYGYTALWLAQSRARLKHYDFERAERHQSELATSKNYMHGRYAIPAITYEVGDETDRDSTRNAARVFAQEMMRVLMTHHAAP